MNSTSDILAAAGAGVEIAGGTLQFLTFVRNLAESNVASAYFRYDGTRVDGSDKIEIELHSQTEQPEAFWLRVKPLDDYVFVRVPINASGVQELIGTIKGDALPDPSYWRWVALPSPNVLVGGNYVAPTAKVDFIIIGYRPKAVLKHFSSPR